MCFVLASILANFKIGGQINLKNYETFRIFECYKYRDHGKGFLSNGETVNEFKTAEENTYICDMLQNMKSLTLQNPKDLIQCTLVFKKQMFREKDESVDEAVFINLSYVQAQSDYMSGIYPIKKDEAISLCAFQVFSDFNIPITANLDETLTGIVEQFIPKEMKSTMVMDDVIHEVALRYFYETTIVNSILQLVKCSRNIKYGKY